MAQIESNMPLAHVEARQGSFSAREGQRQSWAHSLESAGWKSIFETMHNFPGAADFDATARLPEAISRRDTKPGTPRTEDASPGAGKLAIGSSMLDAGATPPASQAYVPPPPEQTAYMALGSRQVVSTDDGDGVVKQTARHVPVALERDIAAMRKVLVLQTKDSGLEVWVRDTRVTGAQMQMLLADIRRNAQNQGNEVVKMSLNGQLIYSDQYERIESSQAKGD